jgi:hypothetical protein
MRKRKGQLNIFQEKPSVKDSKTNSSKEANSFKVLSVERNLNFERNEAIYQKFLSLSNHLDKF